jgi:hypothetical protein
MFQKAEPTQELYYMEHSHFKVVFNKCYFPAADSQKIIKMETFDVAFINK